MVPPAAQFCRRQSGETMNTIFAATLGLAVITAAIFDSQASAQQPDTSLTYRNGSPFACNRLALTPEQRKRHFEELGPALRSLRIGARELPDGIEFKFPSDMKTYQTVAEWVAGERLCCPFFDIDLRAERESGPVWLRLTGREGVKQFIQADFAKWLNPGSQP
jgi:hypothetical protein